MPKAGVLIAGPWHLAPSDTQVGCVDGSVCLAFANFGVLLLHARHVVDSTTAPSNHIQPQHATSCTARAEARSCIFEMYWAYSWSKLLQSVSRKTHLAKRWVVNVGRTLGEHWRRSTRLLRASAVDCISVLICRQEKKRNTALD